MRIPLAAILASASILFAQSGTESAPFKIRPIKLINTTETGDAMVFLSDKGEFTLYIANNEGAKNLKIVKSAIMAKRKIVITTDLNYPKIISRILLPTP